MEEQLELGKTYRVTHNRKGVFDMTIKSQNNEWVSGLVTKVIKGGRIYPDEDITVRRTFCKFKAI